PGERPPRVPLQPHRLQPGELAPLDAGAAVTLALLPVAARVALRVPLVRLPLLQMRPAAHRASGLRGWRRSRTSSSARNGSPPAASNATVGRQSSLIGVA